MEFDVCLTISGLCMFVPGESASGEPVMHVLMPASAHEADAVSQTGGAQGHEHPDGASANTHVVELIYDTRYHRPEDVPETERRKSCQRPKLDGCVIAVRHPSGQPLDTSVKEDCVPLLDPTVGFGGVDPHLVRGPLSKRLAARAELCIGEAAFYSGIGMAQEKRLRLCPADHDASTVRCDPTSPRPPQLMAEHVEWWLGRYCDGVALTDLLTATRRDGTPVALPAGRLSPRAGEKVIYLRLLHAVPNALPDGKCREYDFAGTYGGDHFEMYYQLDGLPNSVSHTTVEAGAAASTSGVVSQKFLAPSVVCVVAQARFR